MWIADDFNDEVVVLFGTDEELDGYDASTPSGPHHLRLSGFDNPSHIDIDPGNVSERGESTWVANVNLPNGEAVKLASDGTELVRKNPTGFFEARFVSVNSRDGSVWVGDPNSGRVAKLSTDGQETRNLFLDPTSLAVDVTDDAVWIGTGNISEPKLLKLDSNGTELLSISGFGRINGIAMAIRFAGTPGKANCNGQSVSALVKQYNQLNHAAAALGFPSVRALNDAIRAFCKHRRYHHGSPSKVQAP